MKKTYKNNQEEKNVGCTNLNILFEHINGKLFYGVSKNHTYLQTKTPHNFHLIYQNRMIQSFSRRYKSNKLISNFYFKKT